MTTIAYYPVVESEEELTDILSRAAWFLTFSSIKRISIFISDPELAKTRWELAPGMDPKISERFDALRELVTFVVVSSDDDIAPVMHKASLVLRWRQAGQSRWGAGGNLEKWLEGARVEPVDPRTDRQEGSNYINVSFRASRRKSDLVRRSKDKMRTLAERVGRHEQAYVLATGPSVGDYNRFDYSDALSIVCNSVILNRELMERVRPEILVFADPIFHFGPSLYAASFRESVRKAASEFDFTIVMPQKYEAVFAAALPELTDRTIALPFRKDRDFNFNLVDDFELKTTANVLTFVMLPLAATFATNIGILGCDGRPLDQNDYFWDHNQSTQINDKMENIREVHPAFFAIDYDDYYFEHCATLAKQLAAGEVAGRRFESLGFSHIPALKDRMPRRIDDSGTTGETAAPRTGRSDRRPIRSGSSLPDPRSEASLGGEYPRLLVIDPTGIGERNATGQIKKALLRGWPAESFLQICAAPKSHHPFAVIHTFDDLAGGTVPRASLPAKTKAEALELIAAFEPDVVYYRPTIDQNPQLHQLAAAVLADRPVPLVTHLMDDWPDRLKATDPTRASDADRALREVLARSHKVLSISEQMSKEFGERYEVDFEVIANGVDVEMYRDADAVAAPEKAAREEVIVRYCGALAKDMTFDTVVDVARAVDALQGAMPLRFEVYTMPTWRAEFEHAIDGLEGTFVFDTVPDRDYPSLLAGADVLVIGYNFDADSLRYIRLSMPNKLPECLASGAAVLAVGPRAAAGIEYVAAHKLGRCVTKRADVQLVAALRRLGKDKEYRESLAETAQAWAFERLDLLAISNRFQTILREAAARSGQPNLLGKPLPRAAGASIDETHAIERLIDARGPDRVLVDVGAHLGSSLAPFAKADWTVIACEPDPANRKGLVKRFGSKENVTIVPRAVSDEPAAAAPFFSSDESSGISALHAFRESHEQSATVEVTTVSELVEAHGLTHIDFLKIDVEGFDWNVLKGVPWGKIQPLVIETEFEDAKTASLGHTYQDVADFLVARGYTVFLSEWHPIVRYGVRHQWRQLVRYPAPLGSDDAWGNILAFNDDPGDEALRTAFAGCLQIEHPEFVEPKPKPQSSIGRSGKTEATSAVIDRATDAVPTEKTPRRFSARRRRIAAMAFLLILSAALIIAGFLLPVLIGAATLGVALAARRARTKASSIYERLHIWTSKRSRVLLAVGQATMWLARKVRSYPVLTALYVAALTALLVLGFSTGDKDLGPLFLAGAGALLIAGAIVLSIGYMGFVIKRTAQSQYDSTRVRLERTEFRQSRIRERLSLAEVRQEHARERLTRGEVRHARVTQKLAEASDHWNAEHERTREAVDRRLDELETEHRTTRGALIRRISESDASQTAARSELEATVGELDERLALTQGDLKAGLAGLESGQREAREALESTIEEVTRGFGALDGLSGSIDELGRELGPRIGGLEEAQRRVEDALESKFGELESRIGAFDGVAGAIDGIETDVNHLLSVEEKSDDRLSRLERSGEQLSSDIADHQRSNREYIEQLGEKQDRALNQARAEIASVSERLEDLSRLPTAINEIAAEIDRLETRSEELGRENAAKDVQQQQRFEQLETASAKLQASTQHNSDELRSLAGVPGFLDRLERDVASTIGELEARVSELQNRLSDVDEESNSAAEQLRRRLGQIRGSQKELAQRMHRLAQRSTDAEAGWQLIHSSAHEGEAGRPVGHGVLSSIEGVSLDGVPQVVSARHREMAVISSVSLVSEVSDNGLHRACWEMGPTGEQVCMAIVLKPKGCDFVQVSIGNADDPLLSLTLDLKQGIVLGGSGGESSAFSIQADDEGWMSLALKVDIEDEHESVLTLALLGGASLDQEYLGRTGAGVLSSEPVVRLRAP